MGGLLNIPLTVPMDLADTEKIFTRCKWQSGRWAITYCIDDVDGLGGHWINMHSV